MRTTKLPLLVVVTVILSYVVRLSVRRLHDGQMMTIMSSSSTTEVKVANAKSGGGNGTMTDDNFDFDDDDDFVDARIDDDDHDDNVKDPDLSIAHIKRQQIDNFVAGKKSLLVNVHITHHGGTAFCSTVGGAIPGNYDNDDDDDHAFDAPDSSCLKDTTNHTHGMYQGGLSSTVDPWRSVDETAQRIAEIRQYYRMVAWEYDQQPPRTPLSSTHWENPYLVSTIVMRHPIDRLLAGDGNVDRFWYPGMIIRTGNGTVTPDHAKQHRDDWWDYARRRDVPNTNNFALSILSQPGCCNGSATDPIYLDQAKTLLQRFTFVLDIECLDESMAEVGRILNLTLNWGPQNKYLGRTDRIRSNRPAQYRDRIGHDDVYEFLLRENRLDIELYEWSKTISIVQCDQ